MSNPGQAQSKTTNGPLHAVTCPNCGRANDMRELPQQQLLDTGSTYVCDHCKRLMEVVAIQVVTVVTVRPCAQQALPVGRHRRNRASSAARGVSSRGSP